jgi:hypothetical protein
MKIQQNPWSQISRPTAQNTVSAIRVAESGRWNYFWALDSRGDCMLLLRHESPIASVEKVPQMRGIEIIHDLGADKKSPAVVIRLTEPSAKDIFFELCSDIVRNGEACATEGECLAMTIRRAWRWHQLLRGGGNRKLSHEEQLGLFGELWVIQEILLKLVTPNQAIAAWAGPLGAAKDFDLTACDIETKTVLTSHATSVSISSEYQLEAAGGVPVFLHVLKVNATSDLDKGRSLDEQVSLLRSLLSEHTAEVAKLDGLLMAAGYDQPGEYSEDRWVPHGTLVARVSTGFPCLTPANLPLGVRSVKYAVNLSALEPFVVAPEDFHRVIRDAFAHS